MKKAIGFFISLGVVFAVLSVFFAMFFIKKEDTIMSKVFSEEVMLDEQEIDLSPSEKEESKAEPVLLIILFIGTGSAIIFGVLAYNDLKARKEKMETLKEPLDLIIYRELQRKKTSSPEVIPDSVAAQEQVLSDPHLTRFELGSFLGSEMNRLLILDFEPSFKKAVIMSDMNRISMVLDIITEKLGTALKIELTAESVARISVTGFKDVLQDQDKESISELIEASMGSTEFNDGAIDLKFPIVG